jgi:tol-pal system protein YbgF
MKINTLLAVSAFAATAFLSLHTYAAESQLSVEQRVQLLEQQAQTRNQLQSDMSIQLIELQKEVKELRGIIEEHDYKLQQIQERQRDLYRDIENRLSNLPKGHVTTSGSQTTNTPTRGTTKPAVKATVPETTSHDGRAEFEAAFNLVRNKKYAEAVQGFDAFIAKYPTSSYSDNARFWIGQVYYAQSNLVEAEKQFSLLRTEYPQSSKLSAAMLKLAEIKVKQQKWQQAKDLYSEIISKYTGATQQLARKGLQDIKSSGH